LSDYFLILADSFSLSYLLQAVDSINELYVERVDTINIAIPAINISIVIKYFLLFLAVVEFLMKTFAVISKVFILAFQLDDCVLGID
jgi:hypothetical protein